MHRSMLKAAIVLILTGILLGAFGAHSLKEILSPEKLSSFETGIKYQFYIGLGILVISFNHDQIGFSLKWFFRLNLMGVICFSGSIYLLALQEIMKVDFYFLWPVTPIGGLLLIIAWGLLLIRLNRKKD